jgi:CRP-like cAMP-binding protein
MFKSDKKIDRLRDIELFAGCSMQELRTIASLGDHIAIREGDVIAGSDRTFFLLKSGEASAGDAVLRPGDSQGSLGLLGGPTEIPNVRMKTDGTVLVVGRREFSSLMHRVPGFAFGIARDLARSIGNVA